MLVITAKVTYVLISDINLKFINSLFKSNDFKIFVFCSNFTSKS